MPLIGVLRRTTTVYLGLSLWSVLGILVLVSAAGAAFGFFLPRYNALALLQVPQPAPQPVIQVPQSALLQVPQPGQQQQYLQESLRSGVSIELTAFRRVTASYSSTHQLSRFLESDSRAGSTAARELFAESERPGFWERSVSPVLAFSKRDQREFGDLKEGVSSTLLGIELRAEARSGNTAAEMVRILGDYFTNALVRERLRDWILLQRSDALGGGGLIEAEIVRLELDIAMYERRVADMKSLLARYPDASRLDARQMVSLNGSEASERFLSPLAQLVGFESAISQRREQITRARRNLKQREMLGKFFADAEAVIERTPTVDGLVPALTDFAASIFRNFDKKEEWVKEGTLRVNGMLESVAVQRAEFGIRNDLRVEADPIRSPGRMAVIFLLAGIVLLASAAFIRASVVGTGSK